MAVLAGLQDSGLRIGSDVDVIAKQTSGTFDLYRPRIDTDYEDIRAAGEALGHLLLRQIGGEPAAALSTLLAPTVNFRTDGATPPPSPAGRSGQRAPWPAA